MLTSPTTASLGHSPGPGLGLGLGVLSDLLPVLRTRPVPAGGCSWYESPSYRQGYQTGGEYVAEMPVACNFPGVLSLVAVVGGLFLTHFLLWRS